ncbi:hypothetical protein FM113_11025 [Leucobacter sp. 7(1)]|uniref:pyridoxamine 5'-phosphate oxidase family protein n=1 Tax=Leucobacter sp. 7(1) TaxID=1255613 RepID=UPI00097F3918|nr:pyridoxamine 5'-phosphate oxidase family protein [Leucobacter sp. 7(1)]SJN11125.1 hypothetical protein FM113_11025 [Leucobacter sp. 7(1)]
METHANGVDVLDPSECWELAATASVGRLVTRVGDIIDIAPVNYVVDGGTLVFRTAAGSKLSGLTVNSAVVFQIDRFDARGGWSLVFHGDARALESESEIDAAAQLPLQPLIPTLKPTFVRISVASVTGRAFRFGEELRREDVQHG